MKTEDLINKYMEINQDEEMYDLQKRYTKFDELPPDPKDPFGITPPPGAYESLREDQKKWLQLRNFGPRMFPEGSDFLWVEEEWKKNYDFIRKYLEKYRNPFGGYLYSDHHYLGYNKTMGILIPEGFKVDGSETTRAWNGREPSVPASILSGAMMEQLMKLGLMSKKWGRSHSGWSSTPLYGYDYKYVGSEFKHKYVLIYSDYYDYGNPWIEGLVGALLGDMYNLRIRKPYIHSKVRVDVAPKAIDVSALPNVDGNFESAAWVNMSEGFYTIFNNIASKTVFNFSWILGEIQWLLSLAKKYRSMIPYPVFPNFGFMGTIPAELIDHNWFSVCDVLDGYFKIPDVLLKRDSKYFEDSDYDLGSNFDPPRTIKDTQPSEPYNPKGFPQDIV